MRQVAAGKLRALQVTEGKAAALGAVAGEAAVLEAGARQLGMGETTGYEPAVAEVGLAKPGIRELHLLEGAVIEAGAVAIKLRPVIVAQPQRMKGFPGGNLLGQPVDVHAKPWGWIGIVWIDDTSRGASS